MLVISIALTQGLWFLSFRVLYLPIAIRIFLEIPWLKAKRLTPLEDGEELRFQTADGVELVGTYLPHTADSRRGVLLFCHEMTGDRWNVIPYLNPLRASGYDVFTFDFRNHGASGSTPYEPLPWATTYEVSDVEAAIELLDSRPDRDPRGVGVLGISRGGSAAMCAATGNPRVRAIVSDGAFPIVPMQVYYMRRYARIFAWWAPVLPLVPEWYIAVHMRWALVHVARMRNCRFARVERIARRLKIPKLMIHGGSDSYIPMPVVEQLKRQLPAPLEQWIVPRAKHNGSVDKATGEYQQRLERFFGRYLAGDDAEDGSAEDLAVDGCGVGQGD